MSGIQAFANCVCLFVNVYGEGYKNAFLNNGNEITWFAQPRQTVESPVIERLIRSEGGDFEDTDENGNLATVTVAPLPVMLFCRCLGEAYVYCGELEYRGHDATRYQSALCGSWPIAMHWLHLPILRRS